MRSGLLCLSLVVFLLPAPGYTDDLRPGAKSPGEVTEARVLGEAGSGDSWLVNGGNFEGHHFSPLTQIDENNVKQLGLAWTTDIPSPTGLSAEPLVVDGVVYLSAAFSRVFALDATTGALLWQFDPQVRLDFGLGNSASARTNRGVAVWEGSVYVGTADCRLIALDAAKGEKRWESAVCDPREADGAAITGAPRVGDDKVFMGYASSDTGVRGSLVAFDAKTGKELWRFWTVPASPTEFESPQLAQASKTWAEGFAKSGGGAVWDGIRYDPVTGLVIFGTASTTPVNAGLRGPGDNLFTNSVLAVRADTGEYAWHYQTVPSDAWDYDAAMPKIIAELEYDGKPRRVVLEAPKNGFLYVLDAHTGALISGDPYVKVTWATHIDPRTGRPVEVPGARYYENEDPEQSVRIFPPSTGAHNWHAMSFSPRTGLLYIPAMNMPSTFSAGGYFGVQVELLGYRPDEAVPLGAGKLVAWDPVKRAERWSVDYPIPMNGGILSTAGGLVFQGTANGEFRAYDAEWGRLLWAKKTGSAIHAAPVSYATGGEQYVLVPVGKGGILGMAITMRTASPDAQGPSRLLAFKLDGKAELEIAPPRHVAVPRPPPRTGTDEQIERGTSLWRDLGCEICHGGRVLGIGRRELDGQIPDLRYMPRDVHKEWHGVVLGGNRLAQGMPAYGEHISVEDSEALQVYVVDQAWKTYEADQATRSR